MGTTKLLAKGVLALGLVAVLSSYGLAAERNEVSNEPSYGSQSLPGTSMMMTDQESTLKRASDALHSRVNGPDGKTLGMIHDLVLAPDLKSISYIALSRGGILGIGNTLYAIPWSSLSQGVNGTFVASVTREQIKQRKGFRPAYWPSEPEQSWGVEVQEPAYPAQTLDEQRNIQARRFTRIKGDLVRAVDGERAGRVQDLVVAMDSGRIAYTIVSYGGLVGIGSRFAVVPQNAVTFEPTLHVARVDAAPATLHANSFAPGQWPDLTDSSYSQQLARAFGTPTGTVLGYVPPVATAPASKTPPSPAARSTTPPMSGTTPSMPSAAAEPTAAELTGTFNPASITTMDGTVIDTGKFRAADTGQDMLWLRIRTKDGQIATVDLGPRNYVSGQDFYIVRGDQIHLTGSQVAATASGKQVFLPTEVVYENHTLRLRSATGTPLWEGQATTTESQRLGTEREAYESQTRPNSERSGTALGAAERSNESDQP